MRKILIIIVVIALFFNTSVYAYDKNRALEYAEFHYNDGKGLCAEFVSDCVNAGGINTYEIECNALVKELTEKYGCGCFPVNVEEDGKVILSKNQEILSVGDVLAQKCADCDDFFHVVICGGTYNGFVTYYAHNTAHGNTKDDIFYNVSNNGHNGHNINLYSVHFYGATENTNNNLMYVISTVNAKSGLNLRSAPSVEGDIVDSISDKSVIATYPELSQNGWNYVDFGGKQGYVKNDYLSETVIYRNTGISIMVNGNKIAEEPVVIEGRTLLPVRAIFEAFGGRINWNNNLKTASIDLEGKVITLKHLESNMYINGEKKDILVPSVIIDNKMYVSARGIAEGLGKTVSWNNGVVTIY